MKRPLLPLAVLFIVGILAGSYLVLFPLLLYLFLALFIILTFFSLKSNLFSAVFLSAAVILFGMIRLASFQNVPPNHIKNFTPSDKKSVYLEGVVRDEPKIKLTRFKTKQTRFILDARRMKAEGRWQETEGKVMSFVYGDASPVYYGDHLLLSGKISQPSPADEPEETIESEDPVDESENTNKPKDFDYPRYLARQNIFSIFTSGGKDIVVHLGKEGNPLTHFVFDIKEKWARLIEKAAPRSQLLRPILLGERERVPEEINELFRNTGTIHILAISGLHVGIVVFILLGFLQFLRLPLRMNYALAILFLIAYCLLTGARASVVRATIIATILLFGYVIMHDADFFNSLAGAGLIILIIRPTQIYEVGFQLSFVAVTSLMLFTPKIEAFFRKGEGGGFENEPTFLRRSKFYLVRGFAASVSAWAGVAPLVAYYFNIVSPIAIFANLLVIPLLTIIVALGFTISLSGLVSLGLARIFAEALWLVEGVLLELTEMLARIPGSYFDGVSRPPPFAVIIFYLLFLLLWRLLPQSTKSKTY